MNYDEAIEYIHNTLKFGSKLGLDNIRKLLELMGNPHQQLRYVHVAGTNGKGSTVAFISSMLIAAGYKVGVFTSPYIERFTERIRVNNEDIPCDDLARITEMVKEKVEIMVQLGNNHPTEFEIVTAIAFQYYLEAGCDIVVLEVGLGGRFDSTNVIDTPLVAVITTISYDHMDILGDTLPKIAYEKAGIIKDKGNVVIYPPEEDVRQVFDNVCREKAANGYYVDFSSLNIVNFDVDGQTFNFEGYKNLRIALIGEHQVRNASVAVKAIESLSDKGFMLSEDEIRQGLLDARWPGRLEVMRKNPVFLIDGAHNGEGAKILADNLVKYFPENRKIFIIGVLKDKDYKTVIEAVAPISDAFVTVTPNSERALPAKDLALFIKSYCKNVYVGDTIEEAVRTSINIASPDDVVCAFGSLYYIGSIRKLFRRT